MGTVLLILCGLAFLAAFFLTNLFGLPQLEEAEVDEHDPECPNCCSKDVKVLSFLCRECKTQMVSAEEEE